MLGLLNSKRYSYSGRESYRHVEKILKRGSNICISSPYIDRHYAEFLLMNSRGKRIRVISSSMDKDAERLLREGKAVVWPLKFSAFMLGLNAILYVTRIDTYAIALLSAAAIACSLLFLRRKKAGVVVRVPHGFVHAKMYIADHEAAAGSANLTFNGMHKNVEHIEVYSDQKDVDELRKQFQDIWNSA